MDEEMKYPIFAQLSFFAKEVLRMIDEGASATIEDVCDNIERGKTFEFLQTRFGFKNINVTAKAMPDINNALKFYYVSENKAANEGLNNNGLLYLVNIVLEDLNQLLYNMKHNDPDAFRNEALKDA